ncbi:amino acid/amide ABC transporter membrane protein 2, HAAT family [Noviherbaspirillum humi]|uniref:Amino acid/amide ABC transporter membrane protein 2, HAAT family n=1 Tax=Noviherbaspirillum humi TaxID=1688639 RepID=A0A239G1V4_9BURK|nr:branched-chain amino acid ABC transporter permease [Noviherbaspirillum humi]SNS63356.1 amino acid/amide ABC transporter membrane protein 2, HAAT family [Noviherbaspirillum humi]
MQTTQSTQSMQTPAINTRSRRLTYKPMNLGRWIVWSLYALALIVAPLVFSKGASLSILSLMGTLIIFSLSYNMLLGQGGMLSFGHAVYSGLGAYLAIHAMNLAAGGKLWIPVSLIPLVGGFAGMLFGILFGYVTTKKSGTTFAMITLGIVELVFACSLMFPEFFGGEGGISTNRVIGEAFMGITYGPQIQVYYLIAFWLFVSTVGMYAFTQTPLGRIINAVRDNPERVEFIGYDTQWARYLTLILSAFFAGISGGLSAINFEIVTAENVSAIRSGAVLLFTFIGGVGFFFGPMIGAIIGVFLTVMLSDYTKAWQLYLGIFFILIVMYAPGGIASIMMLNLRLVKFGKFGRVWPKMLPLLIAALIGCFGAILAIEMLYHLTLESVNGTERMLFGVKVDTAAALPWIVTLGLIAVAALLFWRSLPAFQKAWGEANTEIEETIRKAQA